MDKKEIINLLDNIADILEFRGENSFKVNAYRMGAIAIRKTEEDINTILSKKELHNIKGIGKGLQGVIYEYHENGHSPFLNEISSGIPSGIKDLMKIKGLGPKKINYLYENLKISDLTALEEAARENKLASVKGFGESLQRGILEEIARIKQGSGYVLLSSGLEIGDEVLKRINSFKSVAKAVLTGELKRKKEIIKKAEILVQLKDKDMFEDELKSFAEYDQEGDKYSFINGYPLLIEVYSTTSDNFILQDFQLSAAEGFLNHLPDIKPKKYKNEEEIFKSISFPFIIPEMREKEYFEEPGKENRKNSDLTFDDLKGFLHFHTTYSDGRNTLPDMIKGALNREYKYAAVCDHSKSAHYANGLSEKPYLIATQRDRRCS
jgi:DNA polymerase (family X)